MSPHKLEHFRLLYQKLKEAPILLLSIGMEISNECGHVLLIIKALLLNIKRDGVKALA